MKSYIVLLFVISSFTTTDAVPFLHHIKGAAHSFGQGFGHVGAFTVGAATAGFEGLNRNVLTHIDSGFKTGANAMNTHLFNPVGNGIKDAAVTVGNGIKDTAVTAGNGIKDTAITAGNGIKDAAITTGKGLETAGNTVAGGVVTGANAINQHVIQNIDKHVIQNIDKHVIQNIAMAGRVAIQGVDEHVIKNVAMAGSTVISGVITGATTAIAGLETAALAVKDSFEKLPSGFNTFGIILKDAAVAFVKSDPIVFLIEVVEAFIAGVIEGYSEVPEEQQRELSEADKLVNQKWREFHDTIKVFYIIQISVKDYVALLSSLDNENRKNTVALVDRVGKMPEAEFVKYVMEGRDRYEAWVNSKTYTPCPSTRYQPPQAQESQSQESFD